MYYAPNHLQPRPLRGLGIVGASLHTSMNNKTIIKISMKNKKTDQISIKLPDKHKDHHMTMPQQTLMNYKTIPKKPMSYNTIKETPMRLTRKPFRHQ